MEFSSDIRSLFWEEVFQMAGVRPGGVTLVVVLAWIASLLHVLSGILVLTGVLTGASTEAAWIAIVVGVVSFAISLALFRGSRIARVLVTISLALSLLTAVFFVIAHPAVIATPIVSGIAALIGLILLYSPKANEYFAN